MKKYKFFNKLLNKRKTTFAILACAMIIPTILEAQSTTKGYVNSPTARQVFCYIDRGYRANPDGSKIPNKACREAYLKSSDLQFDTYNRYIAYVTNYNNISNVKKAIPNGTLCSAGDKRKLGINLPSPYWQKTTVKSGEILTITFKASSTFTPSFWEVYVTKPGFDPKKSVLRWEDLILIAKQGDLKPVNGNYTFNVELPHNRKGDAILYTRWQKVTPSGEGFYNCSDITFE